MLNVIYHKKMDNIPYGCYSYPKIIRRTGRWKDDNIGKADGFKDEEYIVIPTRIIADYAEHPLVMRTVYPTDVGFFPKARDHYRERKKGEQYSDLLHGGKGTVEVEAEHIRWENGRILHSMQKDTGTMRMPKTHGVSCGALQRENTAYFPIDEPHVAPEFRHSDNRMMVLFNLLFRKVLRRNYTLGTSSISPRCCP